MASSSLLNVRTEVQVGLCNLPSHDQCKVFQRGLQSMIVAACTHSRMNVLDAKWQPEAQPKKGGCDPRQTAVHCGLWPTYLVPIQHVLVVGDARR